MSSIFLRKISRMKSLKFKVQDFLIMKGEVGFLQDCLIMKAEGPKYLRKQKS